MAHCYTFDVLSFCALFPIPDFGLRVLTCINQLQNIKVHLGNCHYNICIGT